MARVRVLEYFIDERGLEEEQYHTLLATELVRLIPMLLEKRSDETVRRLGRDYAYAATHTRAHT